MPLIIGAIPFGIIFGTLATSNGLSISGALAMSAFVFAGSSQFIAVGLMAAGTGWLLIVLTTFIVNLRHLLYAVSLLPYVQSLPQRWQAILGFFLTDESFAIAIRRYEQVDGASMKHWYFLGASVTMYVSWQLSTLLGITIGQTLPNAANWGLDFAMSVTFIGMIVPYVKTKPMAIATLVSGMVALLAYPLPHKLGLIVAAIAGITAGVLSERVLKPRPNL
ncbi:MAG: AzlC family ABC transporter permease [Roseofilum sp. Guam]|nr:MULTISPECIES: AzlC family ABC transporter permease [Roseofilum]MBP0027604.1 AzlC family ABC transporter permease [Roseofilum sp. Guam]